MDIIINQSHTFELILTDNQGNFVTGQTITFQVRDSITDTLITSGTLTEQNEVYKFSFTFTTLGQFRVKYFTPMNFPNAIESVEIVNSIPDQVWDEPLAGHMDSGTTGEALDEAGMVSDPNAIADAIWDELLAGHTITGSAGKAITDIQAKTDNLPSDPASETNATSNTTSILTALTSVPANVWSFTTRTLTSFGTLVSDVWSFVTRELTGIGGSGIASEANATTNKNSIISEVDANEVKIDAIKNKTDNLPVDPASEANATSNKNTIVAEIDVNEVKIDLITTDLTAHRNAVEQKITFILGLSQHNTRIEAQVYDEDDLISATIKLYANATDAENDTNVIKTYNMTATYDIEGKLTSYIVSEA